MNCKLEVLQENGLVRYKESCLKFDIVEQRTSTEKLMEIKMPVTLISYNKGSEFDAEFRNSMEALGYICTPTNRVSNKEIFINKKDIDEFIKQLPDLEVYYTNQMPAFLETYLELYTHETINFRIERQSIYTGDYHFNQSSYCQKIIRIDIQKKNEELRKQKENENIEFMKRVLNG